MFLIIFLLILLLWLFKSLLINKSALFNFAKNFKGYPFWPIFGNGPYIWGKNVFTIIDDIVCKFGYNCNLWLGHDYYYVTAEAAQIKAILNHPNCQEKSDIYQNFNIIFEHSLLMVKGEIWKRHRKFYSKCFNQTLLNSFVEVFNSKSEILMKILQRQPKEDLFEVFEKFALDTFCESMLGLNRNIQLDKTLQITKFMAQVQTIGGQYLFQYFYYPLILWWFSWRGFKTLKLIFKLQRYVKDIISEKRQNLSERPDNLDVDCFPFLELLLIDQNEKFNEKQIFQDVIFFSMAATDTTGLGLTYFFTLLGMHLDVQEKVYEEVISVIGSNRDVEINDLAHLKYTQMVINESMRIFPAIPIIGRKTIGDVDLGNKILPKGANIFIDIFHLHRNKNYWPDPLKFDPERFSMDHVDEIEPYSFIPFSRGSKNCIGKTYGLMVMKTCIANVIRNFQVYSPYKSVSELKLSSCLTMTTVHPIECYFRSRH
ncbi:hypothetical protein ABEB36_007867 [Hypothenemus hampei]|uniref:Cytochrome P450 n=1 Tax=Hypothenemus hampei TaxID=57062 RepID=A0ABD1EYI0_HYPHA